MKDKPLTHTGMRQFEIVVHVSGWLEGSLSDWPANIQDGVYKALEDKSKEVELPLAIVFSKCDHDPDLPNDHPQKFWLHIVASEVVMADQRTIDPRRLQ